MEPQHFLLSQKGEKNAVIWHVTTIRIHPSGFCSPQIVILACGEHNIATEPHVSVHVHTALFTLFLCRENWFKVGVNGLYFTSNYPRMFTNCVWA